MKFWSLAALNSRIHPLMNPQMVCYNEMKSMFSAGNIKRSNICDLCNVSSGSLDEWMGSGQFFSIYIYDKQQQSRMVNSHGQPAQALCYSEDYPQFVFLTVYINILLKTV